MNNTKEIREPVRIWTPWGRMDAPAATRSEDKIRWIKRALARKQKTIPAKPGVSWPGTS